MDLYCRLCFNENVTNKTNALVPIFGEFGVSLKLQKKIQNRLNIYVDPDDYLPTTVCIFCCGLLEKFEMFLKKAHKVQNKLLKTVHNLKDCATKSTEPDTTIPQSCPSISLMDADEEPTIAKEEDDMLVIEVSDDSSDGFFDLTTDSDVEFVETDFKPLPQLLQPKMDENDDDVENVFEEQSSNEADIKFTKPFKSNQVGASLLEHTRLIETKFVAENPDVDLNDVCVHTKRATQKGSKISMNTCSDKGVQIQISCRYQTRNTKDMSRVNWTSEQKIIMKERFSYHYMYKTVPTKMDTLNFLETAGPRFDGVSEDRVRRFFTNRKYYNKYKT